MKDPVLDWLNQKKLAVLPMEHEVQLSMDCGLMIVRSNAPDIVHMVKEEFCFYHPAGFSPTAGTRLEIDILCLGFFPSIDGAHDFTGSIDFTVPGNVGLQPGPGMAFDLVGLTMNGTKCLSRFPDLLVSLPDDLSQPVRVLLTNCSETLPLPQAKPQFRPTGLQPVPANTTEMADLVKMLYIRRNNMFCIHAAVLVQRDQSILITGASGTGKTTTALSLLRDGFILLSDELTLVSWSNAGDVQIQGLLIPPSISGGLPGGLESLESTLDNPWHVGKTRYGLTPADSAGIRHPPAKPSAIFFLERAQIPGAIHRVEPVSRHDTFIGLMQQALDLTDTHGLEGRTEAIIGLVNACPAYRLTPGRNLRELPQVIRECL